jgi:hypothetical protein
VKSYLSAIEDETRRKDCEVLAKLMTKATKHEPKMWGASIVGFGSYHYKYESGREGDSCLTGFASRKGERITCGKRPGQEELSQSSSIRWEGCLYVRKLSDVDLNVLERIANPSRGEAAL